MTRCARLMTRLSIVAAASGLALAGCGGGREGESAAGDAYLPSVAVEPAAKDESEEAQSAANADDIAYIKALGLLRGRLISFYELYHNGERTDVTLSESNLYLDIVPAFALRNHPGFSAELTAFADAAAAGGDVGAEYSKLIDALRAHTPNASVEVKLLAISEIVRAAGDAFDRGVEDDGAVSRAAAYQDAYGFLAAARDMLAAMETTDVAATDAIGLAHEQIELALLSFGALTAEVTEGRGSTIYDAAARIEGAPKELI